MNKKQTIKMYAIFKYLSLGIADPQELNGCLEEFTAKLVFQ